MHQPTARSGKMQKRLLQCVRIIYIHEGGVIS